MDKKLLLCLIVDDEPLALEILENYIQRIEQLQLVAKCESAEEAYEVLMANPIDVVFLDMDLKSAKGTDIIRKVQEHRNNPYFIIITSAGLKRNINTKELFDNDSVVLIDYLSKPISFERFKAAIDKIFQHNEKV